MMSKSRYYSHGAAALAAGAGSPRLAKAAADRYLTTRQKLQRVKSIPERATQGGVVEIDMDMKRLADVEGKLKGRLYELRPALDLPIEELRVRFYASCPINSLPFIGAYNSVCLVAASKDGKLLFNGKAASGGRCVGSGVGFVRWSDVWFMLAEAKGKAHFTFYKSCWVLQTINGIFSSPYPQSESP